MLILLCQDKAISLVLDLDHFDSFASVVSFYRLKYVYGSRVWSFFNGKSLHLCPSFVNVRPVCSNVYRFYSIHVCSAVRTPRAVENSLFSHGVGASRPLNLSFDVFAKRERASPSPTHHPSLFRSVQSRHSHPRWLLRQRTCTFYDKIRFA